MFRFMFRKGLRFFRGAQEWLLQQRLTDKRIRLESAHGEIWLITEAEIMDLLVKGSLRIDLENPVAVQVPSLIVSRDLSSYSEERQQEALRRFAYVKGAKEHGVHSSSPSLLLPVIKRIAEEIADGEPPHPTTLYRWMRRYSRGQSVICLVGRQHKCGRRRVWAIAVRAAFDEAVETVYFNDQRYQRKEVIDHMRLALSRAGSVHLMPGRASIYRALNELEVYDVVEAREGKQTAKTRFRSVMGTTKVERILERLEIDHTPLNILVFCEKSMLPIGRPTLTLALDKFSRCVVGYYLTFSAPSAYSVLQCLRQSFLPKEEILRKFPDITTPWPARGIPASIVCDNGMDLHAHALNKACLELGIQLQFCPAKRPEYKGSVERFFKTINHNLIHYLPGTVFASPDERGDYDSEKHAAISFEVLNHLVLKWIVEIYHQSPHQGIGGKTPLEKWQEGEQRALIEFPAEPAQLDVILGEPANRRVFHYGVEVNNQHYNNVELQSLRRRHGEELRVDLKFHCDELGWIYVLDPDSKQYFSVPAIDQEYAVGMRMEMHDIVKKQGRYRANNPQLRLRLIEKKHELKAIVEKAVTDKKMLKRKQAAALRGKNTSKSEIRAKESIPSTIDSLVITKPALPAFVVRAKNQI